MLFITASDYLGYHCHIQCHGCLSSVAVTRSGWST